MSRVLNQQVLDFDSSIENLILGTSKKLGYDLARSILKVLKVLDKELAMESFKPVIAKLYEIVSNQKDSKPNYEQLKSSTVRKSYSSYNSNFNDSRINSRQESDMSLENDQIEQELETMAENLETFVRKNQVNLEILFWSIGFEVELWETKRSIYLVTPDEKLKKKLFLLIIDKSIQVSLSSVAKVEIYLHEKYKKKKSKVTQAENEENGEIVGQESESNAGSPKFINQKKNRNKNGLTLPIGQNSRNSVLPNTSIANLPSNEITSAASSFEDIHTPNDEDSKFRASSGMFGFDIFGNKIEKSYAFKPFTPLVYSVTSDYVMEMLIYTSVKDRSSFIRRVSQRPMNLREVVNLDNSENKKQVTNEVANKRIYFCDIRNLAIMLCDKIKSSNLFTLATGEGRYTGNEQIEVSALGNVVSQEMK